LAVGGDNWDIEVGAEELVEEQRRKPKTRFTVGPKMRGPIATAPNFDSRRMNPDVA